MKTFLEYVAEDILSKYGTNLSRTVVVFPNKRASLFLNDALARLARRPIWSPSYITISELFRRHSPLKIADPLKQVCDLHRTYMEVTGFEESIEHFFGWGQLLISDFDDIDKNMAPADMVFANLRDIREYDDISFLNDEQRATLRKFFANFTDEHDTLLKRRFLRLWSHMGDIYHGFNRRLASQGLAYEGAIYRQVAEDEALTFDYDRYIFVGFNLLQVVEQRLFSRLKAQGKAFFYWDFDHYYMSSEAGHFIAQYLGKYPNELPIDDDRIYRNFQRPKTINLMSAPTEDIQARYVSQWLDAQRIKAGRRTAIVLCNEGLLQTVIHCLPDAVEHVNITNGYPLQQTPIASLVLRMLRDHSLEQVISKVTESAKEPSAADDPLTAEAIFRTYTLLNRLKSLIDNGDLPQLQPSTLLPLTTYLIQQTTVPFHGEPAVGLQIMGVLETRNLDFDHILLLSANEGNMPRGVADNSFIPYSLRQSFNLTTADHKSSIYAYYFNRLLSRAKDVTIIYNNSTTDGQTAEMSRFVLQLLVENPYHTVNRKTLKAGQRANLRHPQTIEKSDAVIAILRQRFTGSLLSPTAINRYMRCPLQFYYCYVEGLKEPQETEEGAIDSRQFGNIFHNAAQALYERLMQKSPDIVASDLEQLLKTRVDIERAVDAAFNKEFHEHIPHGGLAVINREVIIHYLRQLVETDRRQAPFSILKLEEDVLQPIPIKTLGITTTIGGRVDRLDRISLPDGRQQIRVIDYKTGSTRLQSLKCVDDIFDSTRLSAHSDYYLQTFLYARIVSHSLQASMPVAPALLFIQHTGTEHFNPVLKFGSNDINDVATPDGDRFIRLLMEKVNEMFDPQTPFIPTTDTDRCRICPYAHLCKG